MPLEGEYEPSPWEPVAEQVRVYEETGGAEVASMGGATEREIPLIVLEPR